MIGSFQRVAASEIKDTTLITVHALDSEFTRHTGCCVEINSCQTYSKISNKKVMLLTRKKLDIMHVLRHDVERCGIQQ